MTFFPLDKKKKERLEQLHRIERDGRVRDRMKAVLLRNDGWTNRDIAEALRVHEETVRQHLTDWITEEKLKPENGGSSSKLTDTQSRILEAHLAEVTYTKVKDICLYVYVNFGVYYTVSGMTKWLKQHHLSDQTT